MGKQQVPLKYFYLLNKIEKKSNVKTYNMVCRHTSNNFCICTLLKWNKTQLLHSAEHNISLCTP